MGERVDIAFFKMCYVDVTTQTDVKKLFADYQDMMGFLRKGYPKVIFLHVTVPVRRVGGGMLGWLREKTRGFDYEREDQVQRHAFNQLLAPMVGPHGFSILPKKKSRFRRGSLHAFSIEVKLFQISCLNTLTTGAI